MTHAEAVRVLRDARRTRTLLARAYALLTAPPCPWDCDAEWWATERAIGEWLAGRCAGASRD